jgi:putative membrane protein
MIANGLIVVVAAIHLYIVFIEMTQWNKPLGLKAFGLGQELADKTKVLGANQGLYNGFLAAGLIYGLATGSFEFKVFFLVCVLVAGLFGAVTASRKILFIQALPAALGLGALWLGL